LLFPLQICSQIWEETGSFDGGATIEEFEDDSLLVSPNWDFFCVMAAVMM
jgi:hypothetical protein